MNGLYSAWWGMDVKHRANLHPYRGDPRSQVTLPEGVLVLNADGHPHQELKVRLDTAEQTSPRKMSSAEWWNERRKELSS